MWMSILGFRYGRAIIGPYKDGHERPDIVDYRQNVYLPTLGEFEKRSKVYDDDGVEIPRTAPVDRPVVIWMHDECTYHQNDQPQLIWNSPEPPNYPQPKGEGRTVMVANLVSSEYGFIKSLDKSVYPSTSIEIY